MKYLLWVVSVLFIFIGVVTYRFMTAPIEMKDQFVTKEYIDEIAKAGFEARPYDCDLGDYTYHRAEDEVQCEEWKTEKRGEEELKKAEAERLGIVASWDGQYPYYLTHTITNTGKEFLWDSESKTYIETDDSKRCAKYYNLPASQLPLKCIGYYGYSLEDATP